MTLKAYAPNLFVGEPVQFGQRYTYVSDHDMGAMLGPGYFDPLRRRLCPGDTLRIVQVETPDVKSIDNRVLSYVDCTVMAVGDTIDLAADKPPVKVPNTKAAPLPLKPKTSERYVQGPAEVTPGRGGYTVKVGKEVVASGLEEMEALAVSRGDAPIPE